MGNRVNLDAQVLSNDNRVAVTDAVRSLERVHPAWLRAQAPSGDVSFAESNLFLTSPRTIPPGQFLIGHPAWRNEPDLNANKSPVRVTNLGGRGHTYTEVGDYGGGFVPQLNIGLTPAPECVNGSAAVIPPGATQVLNLSSGLHKFQCCIHPWMRATIRVE